MKTFLLKYAKRDQQNGNTHVNIDELVKASVDVTQSTQQTIRYFYINKVKKRYNCIDTSVSFFFIKNIVKK